MMRSPKAFRLPCIFRLPPVDFFSDFGNSQVESAQRGTLGTALGSIPQKVEMASPGAECTEERKKSL